MRSLRYDFVNFLSKAENMHKINCSHADYFKSEAKSAHILRARFLATVQNSLV